MPTQRSFPPQERPLVWGLLGASTIAQEYMIPAIRAQKHNIATLLSSSPRHAEQYAQKNKIPHFTTSLPEFFQHKLDAVYISSTNEKHTPQALSAAQNKVHILCEKPLATTLPDAQNIVEAAQNNSIVLATNHHLRCAESVKLIKNILRNGEVGKPVGLRLYHTFLMREHLKTWRLHTPQAGAGVILDVLVHQADLLSFILQEDAQSIACKQQFLSLGNKEKSIEDGAMSVLEFPSGVLAHTHETFSTPYSQTALHILGTKGSVEGYDILRMQGGGSVFLSNSKGRRNIPFPQKNCYKTVVDLFAQSLRGKGQPAADGFDGLKSLAVAIAAKKSAETGTVQSIDYSRINSPTRASTL